MIGAITAILLGLGSIVVIIAMLVVECDEQKLAAERKLFRRWLTICGVALFLLLAAPGVLVLLDLIPPGSLGAGGSGILFFFCFVPSVSWYCRRLVRIRAGSSSNL